MGHVLQVPHARATWPDDLSALAAGGWRVVALTPGADALLHTGPPPSAAERVAVVVGAEGPGLDAATLSAPGVTAVRIGMAPGVDSLNVAMAATVALAHLRAPTLS
jgi:tRNA G18 (ribose-2'-O)-methylase SpoU